MTILYYGFNPIPSVLERFATFTLVYILVYVVYSIIIIHYIRSHIFGLERSLISVSHQSLAYSVGNLVKLYSEWEIQRRIFSTVTL